jgi:hypothetical protein
VASILSEHKGKFRFLLDSGAFTAWRSKKPIALDSYCNFLDTLRGKSFEPWRYFMLDVIYRPVETEANYRAMRARGYDPIPVFTPGSSWEQFDYYYSQTDLLACGGLANKYDPASQQWLAAVMKRADRRKMHLLGYTSPTWLKFHKPYSCDSSTWVNGNRYGAIHVYVGGGEFRIITKDSAFKGLKPEHKQAIERLGFDPYLLQRKENWGGKANVAQQINTASFVLGAAQYEARLGVKMFLATGRAQIAELFAAYDRLEAQRLLPKCTSETTD